MIKYERIQKEIITNTGKVWIRLTRACNNQCLFCLDQEAQNTSFISKQHVLSQLKKAFTVPAPRVVLSGGEPTIHPNFLRIIKETKKMGYQHIQVVSNGRMFSYLRFLEEAFEAGLREITFSFHGHTTQIHDKLTQAKGSFEQSLTGLKNALLMKPNGLIINIDIVINKVNVFSLKQTLLFFIKLGVLEFDLLQVIPFGRAWEQKKELFYNFEDVHTYLYQAFELAKIKQLHIWTNRFPPQYLEGYEFLIQDPVKLYDEIGGRRLFFENFLQNGAIIPCKGARCVFCFLKNFCKDLEELCVKKYLNAYPMPPCIKINKVSKIVNFVKKPKESIFNFLDFYIKHRYFLKGSTCRRCKFFNNCSGMRCDFIKKNSFQSLSPIT